MNYEDIKDLPELEGDIRLECEMDRYDGPISGFVSMGDRLFWFDWCMEALDPEVKLHSGPRLFYAREIPKNEIPVYKNWISKELVLTSESELVGNPHIYPVLEKQKKTLRSIEAIQADLSAHFEKLPPVTRFPVSFRFNEIGEDFAGIKVSYYSEEATKRLPEWQAELAQALDTNNQKAIDALFASEPIPSNPLDIYRVRHQLPDGTHEERLRDFRGQPLPDDFFMTSKHSVQDLTGWLDVEKKK